MVVAHALGSLEEGAFQLRMLRPLRMTSSGAGPLGRIAWTQREDAQGGWVALSGRQKIEAVPFAAWTANASDFQVSGDLAVEGTSTMNGDVTMTQEVSVSGRARLTGGAEVDQLLRVTGPTTTG